MNRVTAVALVCLGLIITSYSSAQTITDQINSLLSGATISGNSWSMLVENRDGSLICYQRNPTTGFAPASNTKIFTTAAAFGLLGTNYAFPTRIYINGTLAGGTLTGDLNLVCEHDPTWNTDVFSNARAPLDYIATRIKALGVTDVTGNAQCYGCCFYNLGSTDSSNHDSSNQLTYNNSAATAFLAALQAQGITVSGAASGKTGFSPPGTLLYTYYSTNLTFSGTPLRLDVACNPLLKESHNVMADALCRHLGYKRGSGDSFGAGALQVLRWLSTNGVVTTNGIVMNDGSGLSHGNRFSAQQTLATIRFMLGAYSSWAPCLPIGCSDGTLGGRFCGTDGSGRVHAKTGSLSISIALSGYIDNKYDNQRYFFSFIANKTSIDQTDTRAAFDAAINLFGARRVPFSPELDTVKSRPNGTSIRITWSDEGFIRTGYRLYPSGDGINFSAPIDLASNVQAYTESALAPGTKRFYKVSVLGTGGESKPSRIYGAQAGGSPKVLIVDGDDRWQMQTAENPNCTNHSFCALAGRNVSGAIFDTANHNAVVDGTVVLTDYPAVIWLLGEEGSLDDALNSTEQTLVANYLVVGGNLFISGSEIAWDLDSASGPSAADRAFFHDQLRGVYSADGANTYTFSPIANGLFTGDGTTGFDNGTKGTYNVGFPDVLIPTNGSVAALTYGGGTGGTAGITYDGSLGGGKIVYWGFPFETITNSATRDVYMSDVLRFFGVLSQPSLQTPIYNPTNNSVNLTWSSSAGLNYRVEYKTNLLDLTWQTLGTDVTATNIVATKVDTGPGTQRFYRVRLVN